MTEADLNISNNPPETVSAQQSTINHVGNNVGGHQAARDVNETTSTIGTSGGAYVGGNVINNYYGDRNIGDTAAFLDYLNLRTATERAGRLFLGGLSGGNADVFFQLGVGAQLRQTEKGPTLRPINGDWLADVLKRFVNFDLLTIAREKLRANRFIILQGPDELLVYQTALWLIYEDLQSEIEREVFPAYQVNMRAGLTDFIDMDRYPQGNELESAFFFSQNVPESVFAGINGTRLQQLKSNLEFHKNYLIITVQEGRNVPRAVLGNAYFHIEALPDMMEVINAVVQCEALPETEKRDLLQQIALREPSDWKWLVPEKPTLKALYDLGDQICLIWRNTNGQNAFDVLFAEFQAQRVKLWFERHPQWEHRSYMMTLAVLDGALPNEIERSYHDLLGVWKLDRSVPRPRLEEMLAGQRQISERGETGLRRITVNGFTTPGFYGLVLYHLWDELYRENDPRLELLIEWLIDLVTQSNTRVRNLAVRAIGTLSDKYFYYIEERIIRVVLARGALMGAIQHTQTLLGTLKFIITVASKLDDDDQNRAIYFNMEQELQKAGEQLQDNSREVQEISRQYFDVLGNMLAYGIESGNEEFKNEILEFIDSLSRADQQHTLVRESPQQIQAWFVEIIHEVSPTIGDFLKQRMDSNMMDSILLKLPSQKGIKDDLTVYQQTAALAVYFYSGGLIVDRAIKDIHRLADVKNSQYLGKISSPIAAVMRTIIKKRLERPGNPRQNIEQVIHLLYEWLKIHIEKIGKPNEHSDKLYRLGIDIYTMLALDITEPMNAARGDLRDIKGYPLLDRSYTDWPMLLYLTYHSEDVEQHVTRILRYLISRRDSFESDQYSWRNTMDNLLDTPRRTFGTDDDENWSLRSQGYAILEYWMLLAVGRERSEKATIHRVAEPTEYINQLKRIVAYTLAWYPSDKTRARMVRFFEKHEKRRQTIAPVATELLHFVVDNTNEDGTPIR